MICKGCGSEFETSHPLKVFCNSLCRARYNSKITYKKQRNNPEEMKRRKKRFKEWYRKNKKRHNLKMRIYMREYNRRKYSKYGRRLENGKKNIEQ